MKNIEEMSDEEARHEGELLIALINQNDHLSLYEYTTLNGVKCWAEFSKEKCFCFHELDIKTQLNGLLNIWLMVKPSDSPPIDFVASTMGKSNNELRVESIKLARTIFAKKGPLTCHLTAPNGDKLMAFIMKNKQGDIGFTVIGMLNPIPQLIMLQYIWEMVNPESATNQDLRLVTTYLELILDFKHEESYSFDLDDGSMLHVNLPEKDFTYTPSPSLQANILQAILKLETKLLSNEEAVVAVKELFTQIRLNNYEPIKTFQFPQDQKVLYLLIYVDENRIIGISSPVQQRETMELVLKHISK